MCSHKNRFQESNDEGKIFNFSNRFCIQFVIIKIGSEFDGELLICSILPATYRMPVGKGNKANPSLFRAK